MSGVRFSAQTAEIATGTDPKTLLQLLAAANHRVVIKEWSISFKGTSNSASPIPVRILKQTTAGTMSALTLVKINKDDDETLQVTGQHTASAEPTAGDVLMTVLVHPQVGYTWQAPFGGELILTGAEYLGIEIHAAANVNCVAGFIGEE